MPPYRHHNASHGAHQRQQRLPPEHVADAFHPFDKLVIALPFANPDWVDSYGSAREWIDLPPNPLKFDRASPRDRAAPSGPPPPGPSSDASGRGGGGMSGGMGGGMSGGGGAGYGPGSGGGDRYGLSSGGERRVQPYANQRSHQPPTDAFHCDACQRGFANEDKYKEHMSTHIYCTVPGCNFTCRANRAYRMEEHMDTLHNRPDAPNLADTGAYLDQRKRRFPTQEAVKDKVEELYYKAARGVVLPDERRRWMRQHGIDIRKRPRTEASFIARGGLPEKSRSPSAQSDASSASKSSASSRASSAASSQQRRQHHHRRSPPASRAADDAVAQPATREEGGARPRFIQPPSEQPPQQQHQQGSPVSCAEDPTAPPTTFVPSGEPAAATAPSVAQPPPSHSHTAPPGHPAKIIPLGPNGTLTPRQRVQLVRERYASAKDVPQFYVCHRCGKKGEHWVAECPTKGDATFDRHVVWGEAKMAPAGEGGNTGKSKARQERQGEPKTADSSEREAVEPAMMPTIAVDVTPSPEPPQEVGEGEVRREEQPEAEVPATLPAAPSPNEETLVTVVETNVAEQEQQQREPSLETAPLACASGTENANNGDDDDAPPAPQSAAPPREELKEVTRMMAPVAAAKRAQPFRRDFGRRPPPPPTLYERLTEEERLNEQGVLLQAMRFFAARNFFQEKA